MADTKKVLLWVGGGCGLILLLVLGTCGTLAYLGKKKLDQARAELKSSPLGQAVVERTGKEGLTGGAMAMTGQMVTAAIGMASIPLLASLPKEEQAQYKPVLEKIIKVGPQLTPQDLDDLNKAMEVHGKSKELPTADEARAFFAQIKAVADRH